MGLFWGQLRTKTGPKGHQTPTFTALSPHFRPNYAANRGRPARDGFSGNGRILRGFGRRRTGKGALSPPDPPRGTNKNSATGLDVGPPLAGPGAWARWGVRRVRWPGGRQSSGRGRSGALRWRFAALGGGLGGVIHGMALSALAVSASGGVAGPVAVWPPWGRSPNGRHRTARKP
jgi:hypothetical protein